MTRFSPFMFGCGLSFPPNNSEVSQCHSVRTAGIFMVVGGVECWKDLGGVHWF